MKGLKFLRTRGWLGVVCAWFAWAIIERRKRLDFFFWQNVLLSPFPFGMYVWNSDLLLGRSHHRRYAPPPCMYQVGGVLPALGRMGSSTGQVPNSRFTDSGSRIPRWDTRPENLLAECSRLPVRQVIVHIKCLLFLGDRQRFRSHS